MKQLTLIRHGKSSWEHNVSDVKRPLKQRGKNDISLIAKEFNNRNNEPIDAVYSSHARRAHDTCMIFIETINFDSSKVFVDKDFYDFSGGNVLEKIKNFNNILKHVLIFGHNYAFTSLVNLLGSAYIDNLPTAGLASINFEVDDWENINLGKTTMLLIPKNLRV